MVHRYTPTYTGKGTRFGYGERWQKPFIRKAQRQRLKRELRQLAD